MTREEAEEITEKKSLAYKKYGGCSCHNAPPCGYCVESPAPEEVEEARKVLAADNNNNKGE